VTSPVALTGKPITDEVPLLCIKVLDVLLYAVLDVVKVLLVDAICEDSEATVAEDVKVSPKPARM